MRFLLALAPLLLPVLGRSHKQCDCQTFDGRNWHYDWQLTFDACDQNYRSTADYDAGAGRCIANPHTRIDGDRWYDNCVRLAKDGYYPVVNGAQDTTQNKMYAFGAGSKCYD